MSYDRIGNILYIKDLTKPYPSNCYAVYLIGSEGRDEHRVYIKPRLVYINKQFKNKNSNLFNLFQNEVYTLHKENGYYFYVNVLKVYFSVRYSHFRMYLATKLEGEFVVVLGDGVGPFSIYLAPKNNFVVGYDYNAICKPFANLNAGINKVTNYVHFTKDCKNIICNFTLVSLVSVMPLQILALTPSLLTFLYKTHYVIILLPNMYLLRCINKLWGTISFIQLVKEYNRDFKIYLIRFEKIVGYLK